MNYSEKLKDPRWQKRRLEVLERDEWCCQSCGDSESTLYVHHLYYARGKEPWDYPLNAYLTMCGECHEYEHNERSGNEKDLLDMIKRAGFLADGVHDIAAGFHSLSGVYPPTSAIIEWVLGNRDLMDSLGSLYFKHLKEINEKATK